MQNTQAPNTNSSLRDWIAIAVALLLPTLVTLLYFVWAEGYSKSVQQVSYAIGKTIQFCFPLVWVCLIQKKRPQIWPWTSSGIAVGIAFGVLVSVAMVALFQAWLKSTEMFGVFEKAVVEKASGMGLSLNLFIAVGIFYSLIHSLLEEYYFRWFIFGQLRQKVSFQPAALISSLGFMAHHVIVLAKYFGYASLTTWVFSLAIAFGGYVWAWLYDRSGSLLGPWVSHLLVDAAIFAIGFHILTS